MTPTPTFIDPELGEQPIIFVPENGNDQEAQEAAEAEQKIDDALAELDELMAE